MAYLTSEQAFSSIPIKLYLLASFSNLSALTPLSKIFASTQLPAPCERALPALGWLGIWQT